MQGDLFGRSRTAHRTVSSHAGEILLLHIAAPWYRFLIPAIF